MMASQAADRPGPARAESQNQVRQLFVATGDTGRVAKIVDAYCVEYENRAAAVLAGMDVQ